LDHLSVFLIRCQEKRVLGITRQIHGETQVITVYSLLKMNNTSRSSLQKHAHTRTSVVLSLTGLLKTVV
ncbi:hypothetical protein T12_4083, partial [Trichinella patagoniensis]